MTRSLVCSLVAFLILATSSTSVQAQAGLGDPGAYLGLSPARIGGILNIEFGHDLLPNRPMLFAITGSYGPEVHPVIGLSYFSYSDPGYQVFNFTADSTGRVTLPVGIANDPALFNLPPLYAHAFVADASVLASPGYGLTKTVRIQFETQDGYRAVGALSTPRALFTATSLAADRFDDETRVLITGGGGGTIIFPMATASTEFYNPMLRAFQPGPTMLLERTGHRAVRLDDGRVLIVGGNDSTGLVTPTCEIYDPFTNSFTATGSMNDPRTGHAITLLNDGRVLATGGMADYVNAGPRFAAVLNSSLDTAELYDPISGQWNYVNSPMASQRSGHRQVLLSDGRVLIIGGISGSAVAGSFGSTSIVPVFTATTDIFDPASGTLASAGNMIRARAWHGASLTNSGDVLVTGGFIPSGTYGEASASSQCELWNGSTWQATAPLGSFVGFHTQTRSGINGDAIVLGGYIDTLTTLAATAAAYRHNGVVMGPTQMLGTHTLDANSVATPRAGHRTVRLFDGSYLMVGGYHINTTLDSAFVIVEH